MTGTQGAVDAADDGVLAGGPAVVAVIAGVAAADPVELVAAVVVGRGTEVTAPVVVGLGTVVTGDVAVSAGITDRSASASLAVQVPNATAATTEKGTCRRIGRVYDG